MVSAISDWVGSLSLGLNGQSAEHQPSEPVPNGRRPSETGGHCTLLHPTNTVIIADVRQRNCLRKLRY